MAKISSDESNVDGTTILSTSKNNARSKSVKWNNIINNIHLKESQAPSNVLISFIGGDIDDAPESYTSFKGHTIGILPNKQSPYIIWSTGKVEEI